MAWSVDRLGRFLQQLVALLSDLQAKGVDLYLHQQGIDTTTPAGTAMFQMCGVFAHYAKPRRQSLCLSIALTARHCALCHV
ncbi:MAG TPA: recombinase family protein [Lamprocystis sp. (in: g-proteobacteria)]|nr:recombinase family protein [Lamprocystis sp. (in: g-proteobacteria)]